MSSNWLGDSTFLASRASFAINLPASDFVSGSDATAPPKHPPTKIWRLHTKKYLLEATSPPFVWPTILQL
jgi:hypothetical protein